MKYNKYIINNNQKNKKIMAAILINYSGWLKIEKNNLKIVKIEDFTEIDTTDLTADEVVALLDSGKAVLKSFDETFNDETCENEIDHFDFDVEIVANSSVKMSKELEKAESRADLQDAAAMPNVFNVEYFAERFAEKRGLKKDEALNKQSENPMQKLLGGSPQPTESGGVKSPLGQDSLESMLNAQF